MNECGHTGPVPWMNEVTPAAYTMNVPTKNKLWLLTCLEPPNTSFFFDVGIVEDKVEICSLEQNYQIKDKLLYMDFKLNRYVVL
jgi:hypothetical protein